MRITALVSLFAVSAFAAAAASPVDGDVRFVRALQEQDPARKSAALLAVAEQDKHPAELALIHLTRTKLPPGSFGRLLSIVRRRSGELVPTVLLVRSFRAECDPARPEPMPCRELFDLAHTAWKNAARRPRSPFEQALFRELSGEVMALAVECGETEPLFPELKRYLAEHVETWDRDLPPVKLLEFCYRYAFRAGDFELYSDDWARSPLPCRRIFAGLLEEMIKRPPENDDDALARIKFLLDIGKGETAFVYAAARVKSADGNEELPPRMTHLIYAAIESGRIEFLQEIESKLRPEMVPLIKAQALVCAGRAREALQLLERIPDPGQRAELKLRCHFALGEFSQAAAMAKDPASKLSEEMRLLTLLALTDILNDRSLYDAAERLAGKRIATEASKANSFGYTALLLGLDRDLAEKRIRHALSLRPRESSYLDSLAWARYLAGDHAGAWKYMEQALRYCEPEAEHCELLQHAGAIRLALGDREGARRYCTQALKLAQAGEKDPKRGPFFRRHSAEIRKLLEQLK